MAASRIATLIGEDVSAEQAHIARLCREVGVAEPEADRRHYICDAKGFRLVWERHTELSTYTIFAPGLDAPTFEATAAARAPADWLAAIPGLVIAASHVAVTRCPDADAIEAVAQRAFGVDDFIETETGGGAAYVFSDFRPQTDGFTRFLVLDRGTNPPHRGRLVQKLLEIETYRLAALLALPLAREIAPDLGRLENELVELTDFIIAPPHVRKDRDLLMRLSNIAARTEALGQKSAFRFAASRAYHRIVLERIESLREARVDRRQRVRSFMERRLDPAMRTVEATETRRRDLADRVGRAAQLLLARIETAVEEQNQLQLASLDRRAKMQLRLQETVEGLSIIAVTYYGAGLVHYLAAGYGAYADGLGIAEIAPALAAPFIALLSFIALRRAKRGFAPDKKNRRPRITRDDGAAKGESGA